jgi:hypothetical protein
MYIQLFLLKQLFAYKRVNEFIKISNQKHNRSKDSILWVHIVLMFISFSYIQKCTKYNDYQLKKY